MPHLKPALSVQRQLQQLKARAMVFNDEDHVLQWLKTSYYRLSAYFYPFKQADESLRQGTTFATIRMVVPVPRRHALRALRVSQPPPLGWSVR
jgi:abortive infection bacteriophage resistance protein